MVSFFNFPNFMCELVLVWVCVRARVRGGCVWSVEGGAGGGGGGRGGDWSQFAVAGCCPFAL